mmetsp:Transcript_37546/g.96044  ORF Transcript_37546/g.96044 Transcript_37546/m.96044 type:complete len:87 (-) Transcript_37546:1611-1871(-)|eukprot:jgi/Tetstr1/444874/TSEL_032716.t1
MAGEQESAAAGGETESAGPRPHRCNDRVEDIIQCFFEFQAPSKLLVPAWDNFWRCMNAEPGQEPADPYLRWTPQPIKRRVRKEEPV